jgi:alpha-D-ribose 1-methylphosphonate 5-triphosphate synthase subunit PhnG
MRMTRRFSKSSIFSAQRPLRMGLRRRAPEASQDRRMDDTAPERTDLRSARQRWLGVLAKAPREEIESLAPDGLHDLAWRCLRAPEIGMVMLRGRTGGDGAPFNLGETTVTRCSVELEHKGRILVGHGTVMGRDRRHAQLVALLDALLQHPDERPALETRLVAPLAALQDARRRRQARKAAATKVNFFTMVRGED